MKTYCFYVSLTREEIINILVTGAEGYIGSHLIPYLRDKGYNILPYTKDILDFKNIDCLNMDMVIHLAALTGVRNSFDKQEEYYDTNVNGSRAIFKACVETNTKIIYASSSNAKEWWTNPYAVTKKIMEEIAPSNSVGVRPHTVYPGRPDMLYDQLKRDPKSITYINGNHIRDFTHIEDFCSGVFTLLTNYDIIVHNNNKIIDIGTGFGQSVLTMARSMGWEGEIRNDPTPKEREFTIADTTILKSLGWEPKHRICS